MEEDQRDAVQRSLTTLGDVLRHEGLFFLARALAGRKNLAEAVDTMKKAVEVRPSTQPSCGLAAWVVSGSLTAISSLLKVLRQTSTGVSVPPGGVRLSSAGSWCSALPPLTAGSAPARPSRLWC